MSAPAGPTTTLREVVALLEARYPVDLAADWDAVGLVVGDPEASVHRVLFAVDPAPEVVDEALDLGADLVVSHHPVFLHGTTTVARTSARGRLVHDLITHGIGLYAAHTNADHARPGVSDALADALDVRGTVALEPVPSSDDAVGTGRVGRLAQPTTLRAFADVVAAALPSTSAGVRIAGDPDRVVEVVAVCGGSGDSLLAAVAASGADVYVTSDLRHHRAQDHLLDGGCALVDVAHWAGEWPWLAVAASALAADVGERGSTVDVHVSTICTDPWSSHRGSAP